MEVTTRSESDDSSLFAHNVQAKVSPMYAEPNAGGRVSCSENQCTDNITISKQLKHTAGLKKNSPSIPSAEIPSVAFESSARFDDWVGGGNCCDNEGLDRLQMIKLHT